MTTVALDTETFLIFPGNLAPEMVCVSWASVDFDPDSGLLKHDNSRSLELVERTFGFDHSTYANAPFDLAVFMAKWSHLIIPIFEALDDDRVHDVQMREKLIDLAHGTFRFEEDEDGEVKAKGYSLFDITKRRLGIILDKDSYRMKYHDFYDVPLDAWPEGARHYATTDAIVTLKIHEAQEQFKAYLGNETAQVRAHVALHLMSCRGFMTDSAAVEALAVRVARDIEEIRDTLIESELVRKDGSRNTKEAVRRMIGTGCIRPTTAGAAAALELGNGFIERAREQGRYVSVAEDACLESGDDILIKYSRYSQLQSLLTGSIKDLRTGCIVPIQPRYEPLMETGRTSASKPNVQNLRKAEGVRECFVPRDGHVIIACDYAAAELHTLAQACYDLFKRSKLGDAMNNGLDPHTWLGSKLVRVDYEAMDVKNNEEHANARQVAKAANFGFPGGCSPRTFAIFARGYGCDITEMEAAQLKSLWLNSWDEMNDYFRFIRECAIGDNFFAVKQLRVERIRGKCTYTAACNSLFQGLAADGAKAAGYELTRRQFCVPTSPLYSTRLLAFVHDEWLLEAPEDRADEIAQEMSAVMETEFNKFVPDCPTRAEATIMRRWSKKAKPTFNTEGKLIPWEP